MNKDERANRFIGHVETKEKKRKMGRRRKCNETRRKRQDGVGIEKKRI